MNRKEKILLAIEKGYTCDPVSGKVYGIYGREVKRHSNGYIIISILEDKKQYNIAAHQFVYYCVNKEIVDCIDHINGVRDDNRIENLRSVTQQENCFNVKYKGCTYDTDRNKWRAQIRIDGKKKNLGRFDTEQQAHQAYLDAKKKYHIINVV
jgi:hypothetical protein